MKTSRKERKGGRTAPAGALAPKVAAALVPSLPVAAGQSVSRPLSPRLRLLISLALLFHLSAVLVAALRVPPMSQLINRAARPIRWYIENTLVNPGYRFFAPNPGPADMMRAEIVPGDGERREKVYPDLSRQWPRLLYHRHFMLTSRLAGNPGDPMVDAFAGSYARHLAARHEASEVRIFRLVHLIPSPEDLQVGGMKLTDPSLFVVQFNSPVGEWTSSGQTPFDATRLTLRVGADSAAALEGEIIGRPVRSSWTWRPARPGGPLGVEFFDEPGGSAVCRADMAGPDGMMLHYPLPGGGMQHVLLRRDPPPLAVYRGEQP
jgi:hypothetical protein